MPVFSIHNHSVFYKQEGSDGTRVLLGHSSASTGGQWKAFMAGMSDQYQLLAPDHIGYGKTASFAGTPDIYTLEVDALEHILNMQEGAIHLVGHSYGGLLVGQLALRHPTRIRSLTLVEPTFFHLLNLHGKQEAFLEIRSVAERVIHLSALDKDKEAARGFIDYWVGAGGFDRMKEKIQAFIVAAMPKVALEFQTIFDLAGNLHQSLPALTCPKLLVSGGKSTQAAHGVVEILRDYWPDATTWMLDEGGHMLPVSHPKPVNARIKAFILDVDAKMVG